MATVERVNSTPSVPPPPPPIEDSNYTVRYGNGADTYTNNHMADDESVEAQHVVYTFAEENGKDKVGRKKWICLMLSIAALLVTIIALGAVYGTQRRNRNKASISAIEEAENAVSTNATDTEIPAGLNVTIGEEDMVNLDGNSTLNGTLVGNMTMGNATNATNITSPPEPTTGTLDPSATVNPSVTNTVWNSEETNTAFPSFGTSVPSFGTVAPSFGTVVPEGASTGAPGAFGTGAPGTAGPTEFTSTSPPNPFRNPPQGIAPSRQGNRRPGGQSF